ncbi:hypothetical protein F4604DRAFT_1947369 [Suillus subluteus]|nr:hypothetical protein F4604DRAFT_1947369 [Suillus subluteus]
MVSNTESEEHLAFDLSDMANIFEYAGSRLLAAWTSLNKELIRSARFRNAIGEYLDWEAKSFIPPWVALCEKSCVHLPLTQNLKIFIGMLHDSDTYEAFMKIPVEPSSTWIRGSMAKTYKWDWWNTAFQDFPCGDVMGLLPSTRDLRDMMFDHFMQLDGNTCQKGLECLEL